MTSPRKAMDDQPSLTKRITTNWIARADRLEDHWRDFTFLGLTETLHMAGGFSIKARQLTVRSFLQLCAVRSPFMVGGRIGPEHVAQILWRLSPDYSAHDIDGRTNFIASIRDFPFHSSTRAINRFLDRMFIDKPPQALSRRKNLKSDTSFAASVIHMFAKSYGWSPNDILDLPMPQIFQFMRNINRDTDPDIPHFNSLRDRITARISEKVLASRNKQNAENHHG